MQIQIRRSKRGMLRPPKAWQMLARGGVVHLYYDYYLIKHLKVTETKSLGITSRATGFRITGPLEGGTSLILHRFRVCGV